MGFLHDYIANFSVSSTGRAGMVKQKKGRVMRKTIPVSREIVSTRIKTTMAGCTHLGRW